MAEKKTRLSWKILLTALLTAGCRINSLQQFYQQTPQQAFDSSNLSSASFCYMLQGDITDEKSKISKDLIVMDYSKDGTETNKYTSAEISSLKTECVL